MGCDFLWHHYVLEVFVLFVLLWVWPECAEGCDVNVQWIWSSLLQPLRQLLASSSTRVWSGEETQMPLWQSLWRNPVGNSQPTCVRTCNVAFKYQTCWCQTIGKLQWKEGSVETVSHLCQCLCVTYCILPVRSYSYQLQNLFQNAFKFTNTGDQI